MIVPVFYFTATSLMRGALIWFTRWHVEGSKGVPVEGPLIVVANHLSSIDPPLIAASLPRRVRFMAKEEMFHSRLWSWSYRGYGAFPVRRGEPDRRALHQADLTLKQGLALGMFPEGRRSDSGQLNEAALGVSLVAMRSGAPILPVGITGTEKFGKTPLVVLTRPRITVRVGEPFRLQVEGRPSKAALEASTELIMRRIAELLPEKYRGEYGNRLVGATF